MAEIADGAWRDAEAAMDAMLRSRGIDPDTAADVKQAVALRAIQRHRQRPFLTRNGFVKWAVWVAWNQATDEWRAERRRRIDPRPVPDVADVDDGDVEQRARLRVAVAQVAAAWAQLTPMERDAIAAPLRPGYTKSTAAERDRRYEARMAMRRHVTDFPAALPALVLRGWRRVLRAMTAASPAALPLGAAVIAMMLAPPTAPTATAEATAATPARMSAAPNTGVAATLTAASGHGHGPTKPTPGAPPAPARPGGAATGPRVDVAVPRTPAGVHVAAPDNDHTKPLVCTETFASPRTCLDTPPPPRQAPTAVPPLP